MISARPERRLLLLLAALLAAPALAARPKPPPPLPPLELDAAAPVIEVDMAGQRVRLTVDPGGDDIVQINPDSPARAALAAATRPDGSPAQRGLYRVAVGQSSLAIPFSRETLAIAGQPVVARVLLPATAPPGQPAGSDGVIGLPLLPQLQLRWRIRAATPADQERTLPARIGRSDAWGFDWDLPGAGRLDVELHPLRHASVISAAAASELARVGDGRLVGPAQRVAISFAVVRPVRLLQLARPVPVANVSIRQANVRLFDWAGRSTLPPDADPEPGLAVVGKRGRQDEWRNLKLGTDVLGRCASLVWRREPGRPDRGSITLVCPAG